MAELFKNAATLLEWEIEEAEASRDVAIETVDGTAVLADRPPVRKNNVVSINEKLWTLQLRAATEMLAQIGIDSVQVQARVLPTIPQLARLRTESVAAIIHDLTLLLGSSEQTAAAVLEEPLLLGYDAKEHLEPGIQYLLTMNAMSERAAAGKLAAQHPGLLKWAIEGKMKERRMSGMLSGLKASTAGTTILAGRAFSDLASTRKRTGL
mmetsp:Transcript_100958/g.200555  ORF Transcript_100958/g.200555 Transcript_100958/m.200555 type:complete len:209 (+) Transcript_100958:51-677(+)